MGYPSVGVLVRAMEPDRGQSSTQVSSFDTSMPSAHSNREQTKLLAPGLPSPGTRLIFICGCWHLGH